MTNDPLTVLINSIGRTNAEFVLKQLASAGLAIYKKKPSYERGKTTSARMTPALRDAILLDIIETDLTGSQIAAKHNVNIGRVSELRTRYIKGQQS